MTIHFLHRFAALLVAELIESVGRRQVLNLFESSETSVALTQAMQDKQMSAGACPVLLTCIMENDINRFGDLLRNHC